MIYHDVNPRFERKQPFALYAAALALLVGTIMPAQSAAQSIRLTLADALRHTLESNSGVRKAHMDILGGKYKTDEVRAQALPQISGTAGITDQLIKPQFVLPGDAFGRPGEVVAIESGTTYNANAGISVNQQLFNKQVFAGLKASKASEEFYRTSASLTEENALEQTATAYYQVLVNRQQLGVIDANIRSVQQVEKTVTDQFRSGLAKRIDLDRVRVNLTNLRTQREQLVNAVIMQENALKFYIGMPVSTPIVLPEDSLVAAELKAEFADTVNYEAKTEYRLLKKQEDLLQLRKKAYEAEYYPSLSLSGSYSYNGMSNKFDLFRKKGDAFWYDMSSVGLSLRIPVFSGGATKAKIRQADVDLLQIREDQRNAKQSLNLANENAKIQIRNSMNTIKLQAENVQLAEEVYTSTRNNYQNGLATLTDLLDAETARTAAQNSYSQALLNYKLAEIQIIKANGNIKSLLN
ncbi:MAG TPA: TolC family protein [Sphingobacteriaceae bacterium]